MSIAGAPTPDLVGHYFFADWCSGEIWSLSGDPGAPLLTSWLLEATPALSRPVTFGEDIAGELYVGDQDGRLYQLTNPTVTAITLATSATPGASRAPALVAALLLFVILTLTARGVGRARPAEEAGGGVAAALPTAQRDLCTGGAMWIRLTRAGSSLSTLTTTS